MSAKPLSDGSRALLRPVLARAWGDGDAITRVSAATYLVKVLRMPVTVTDIDAIFEGHDTPWAGQP